MAPGRDSDRHHLGWHVFGIEQKLSPGCAASKEGSGLTPTPRLLAAALILLMSSCAISGMREETSVGLGHEIKCAQCQRFEGDRSAFLLCELTTMTGTRWRRMISFSMSMPFMPGISRSRVTTCGRNSSIFLSPKFPSMAVPTTSMEVSVCKICGINLRMSAESSTTRTRTGTHCRTSAGLGAIIAFRSECESSSPGEYSPVVSGPAMTFQNEGD